MTTLILCAGHVQAGTWTTGKSYLTHALEGIYQWGSGSTQVKPSFLVSAMENTSPKYLVGLG